VTAALAPSNTTFKPEADRPWAAMYFSMARAAVSFSAPTFSATVGPLSGAVAALAWAPPNRRSPASFRKLTRLMAILH
jgi:hypothetical protein